MINHDIELDHWQRISFADAVLINPTVSLKRGESYPFLDMASVSPNQRYARANEVRSFTGGGSRFIPGDTLMARITPCLENGKICRYGGDGPTAGSTEFIVIRGRPNLTTDDFAYYLTQSRTVRDYAISKMTGSSGRQRVPTDVFERLEVKLPPLPIQKRIAHILGTLDDKIELNRRMNETLESMARAIFQSWFIDFDPVHAKAAGRTTGLPKPIADLFPVEFQNSELGLIPKGWATKRLYDAATFVNGAAFREEHFTDPIDGIPVIKIGELKHGVTEQTKYSNRPDLDQKYGIDSGDVLFSWSGSPDTSIDTFLWTGGRGFLNQHIFRVTTHSPNQRRFVYYLLKHLGPEFIEIARNKQTTGLGHVTAADMRRLKVVLPAEELLESFDQIANHLFERAFQVMMESENLAKLRDSLISKLISGEIQMSPISVGGPNGQ